MIHLLILINYYLIIIIFVIILLSFGEIVCGKGEIEARRPIAVCSLPIGCPRGPIRALHLEPSRFSRTCSGRATLHIRHYIFHFNTRHIIFSTIP